MTLAKIYINLIIEIDDVSQTPIPAMIPLEYTSADIMKYLCQLAKISEQTKFLLKDNRKIAIPVESNTLSSFCNPENQNGEPKNFPAFTLVVKSEGKL